MDSVEMHRKGVAAVVVVVVVVVVARMDMGVMSRVGWKHSH
jgi:type II secretory pathway component PulK